MCMQVGSMYAMDGRRHGRGVGGLCRWRRTRLGGVLYSRVRRLASPWTGCACMQETVSHLVRGGQYVLTAVSRHWIACET